MICNTNEALGWELLCIWVPLPSNVTSSENPFMTTWYKKALLPITLRLLHPAFFPLVLITTQHILYLLVYLFVLCLPQLECVLCEPQALSWFCSLSYLKLLEQCLALINEWIDEWMNEWTNWKLSKSDFFILSLKIRYSSLTLPYFLRSK